MKSHSLAPSLGRSSVGSTQESAIQFATVKCCLSAKAVIRRCAMSGEMEHPLWAASIFRK
ncbi:hypothetical protein OKW43_007532 [Paraburkholderia sp. WC7.3g]